MGAAHAQRAKAEIARQAPWMKGNLVLIEGDVSFFHILPYVENAAVNHLRHKQIGTDMWKNIPKLGHACSLFF